MTLLMELRIIYAHSVSNAKLAKNIGAYQNNDTSTELLERITKKCTQYEFSEFYRKYRKSEIENGDVKSFFLTFDDGYKDFIENVLPILEKYDVKTILFITTGFVGRNLFPYEFELSNILIRKNTLRTKAFGVLDIAGDKNKMNVYDKIRIPLKTENSMKRQEYMDELADLNGIDRNEYKDDIFLTWKDVKAIDRHPLVTIGAHTYSHAFLPSLSIKDAWQEIIKSKREIEKVVGHSIESFSYPYGGFNAKIRFLVKLCGFRFAFITESKQFRRLKSDKLQIPRTDINSQLLKDKYQLIS